MRKTRKITKTEEYDVCDLCGKEITDNGGNRIDIADKTYLVHLMTLGEEVPCGFQLIADTIDKK